MCIGYMQILCHICKYYAILHKGLKHLRILVCGWGMCPKTNSLRIPWDDYYMHTIQFTHLKYTVH